MLIFALLACDGGPGPLPTPIPGDSANYSGSLGAAPDFSGPHARLQAVYWDFEATGVLSGDFKDGPLLSFHEEDDQSGSCRLMTYTPSTCSPDCTPGTEACIGGTCVAWALRQDRGPVEWTFPGGSQTVQPDGTLGYYATASMSEAGAMSLTVEGTQLDVPQAPPLEADGDWANALSTRGADDGVLRWSNPMEGARVRLHMTDCTATHGGIAAAEIECEGPDTGELVIPAAYLDTLAAGDWSHGECGSHTFERYHAASPQGDDTVRFESLGPGGLFYRFD